MAKFKLSGPLSVPLLLLKPTYTNSYGVESKTFDDGTLIYGTFRTFGGNERNVNGLYSVENTATVETWYRPDITSNCRIKIPATGAVYDVLGEPENINMRNQYIVLKLIEVKGGA